MITKITIKLDDGTEFILEMDKARELYFQLDSIFGKKIEYIPYPYKVYPQPYKPMWAKPSTGDSPEIIYSNTN